MANYIDMMRRWRDWRLDEAIEKESKESINENTVVFSKDDMEKLHRDGKLIKDDSTYIYSED